MTWSEIMDQRHREAREREQQTLQWAREVTEQLMAERSRFMRDFDENEKRIFGCNL